MSIRVAIEKYVQGGSGLGYHNGLACFIPGSVPGDTVTADITHRKKNHYIAELRDVLHPSPHRTEPLCSLFGRCGGCQWQNCEYSRQLYWKRCTVSDCLRRIGGIQNVAIRDTIASPDIFHYRFRMNYKIQPGTDMLGLYRLKSHSIIPVQHCFLAQDQLNSILSGCRPFLVFKNSSRRLCSEIDIRYSASADSTLISFRSSKGKIIDSSLFSHQRGTHIRPADSVFESVQGLRFRRSLEGFYQVNHRQNLNVIAYVQDVFASHGCGSILDIYCGCGNFSLFLAGAAYVIGIESNPHSVDEARLNADENGIANCRFITADASEIPETVKKCDGILLNPPRQGCEQRVVHAAVSVEPSLIVYVSCNPATLARDAKSITSLGYAIDSIQPFDMFPHTYHTETVTVFTQH